MGTWLSLLAFPQPRFAVQVSLNSEASPKPSSRTSSCPCSVASSLSLSQAGGGDGCSIAHITFWAIPANSGAQQTLSPLCLLIQVHLRSKPPFLLHAADSQGVLGTLSFSSRFPLMKCWGKGMPEHSATDGTGARSCSESASLRSISSTALQRCLSLSLLP